MSARSPSAKSTDGVSPSMRQFFDIKADHPGALLFFRMGDFYELFFDDAVAAAAALDIALTKRGQHLGEPIPMCGVPAHAAEGYLASLTRKGFTIAICEQMENPAEAKKRGSKSVVRRDVVRIVTPGTLTEDTLLDARAHNYLAAYAELRGEAALAWVDISAGVFEAMTLESTGLGAELARLAPSEVLVTERLRETLPEALSAYQQGGSLTPLGVASFDSASAEKRLSEALNVSTLDAFGAFTRAELSALGALVDYIALTQKGSLPHLPAPRRWSAGDAMRLDASTRRNLELTEALSGGRKGSLLAAIDCTVTGAGARLLAERIAAPLTDPAAIDARLDAVSLFVNDPALAADMRAALAAVPDIARALSRLSLGRGGPRDLAALREGLAAAGTLALRLDQLLDPPLEVAQAARALYGHEALVDQLRGALIDEPPMLTREGGYIAPGWNAPLDAHRQLRDDSRRVIRDMEAALKTETEVAALKVKYNGVLGYFIEVPAAHGSKLIEEERFIHRQTMANAMRFSTAELSDLDSRISRAGALAVDAELTIFEQLRAAALDGAQAISQTAAALAQLDVASAFGELSAREGWVRPQIEDGAAFAIHAGRHPVVEAALKAKAESFVANDCDLSDDRLWLLTGPNMAGKSTFLRQNALIAILAQSGSYVPAQSARIGVVDRLFSRVGASDDLARGHSTFMVEMVETAAILHQSGPGALVILDEIGRGTATFDGLSIAWAVFEHLHDVNGCRGLFATHYHEMTELAARLDAATNAAMKVAEWEGDVVFLHEVQHGAATRSYGIQVAKKAGLPEAVLERAREVLERLESSDTEGGARRVRALVDDLPLFAALQPAQSAPAGQGATPSAAEQELRDLDPDALTPREALDALYRLRGLID